MGVGGQRHTTAALHPGRRVGGLQHRCRKSRLPLGFDPWTVQPVANHYTD
jgi:hypothetical protein